MHDQSTPGQGWRLTMRILVDRVLVPLWRALVALGWMWLPPGPPMPQEPPWRAGDRDTGRPGPHGT